MSMIGAGLADQMVNILAGEKLNTEELCKKAGINLYRSGTSEKFIPLDSVVKLMQLAELESGNPNIGLKAYQHFLPGTFQLVGYVMMSSATLRDAIQSMMRFSELLGNGATSGLAQEKNGIRIWYTGNTEDPPQNSRVFNDAIMTSTLAFCSLIAGGKLPGVKDVEFAYPTPPDISEHQKIFGCPLHFNAGRYSILFDNQALSLPLSTANAALSQLHDRLAEHQKDILKNGCYSERTRAILIKRLSNAPCDMDSVAKELNINPRSLQREISKEGESFKGILNKTRKELAEYYLKNFHSYPLERISELLGFKELSSFHKACLRWFNTSPGNFRNLFIDGG
ncbi:TPA: AraC family transcriptional regulator [Pseudomonas aeruginosa]|uniref:AraC family transcriptional regulator n=2 Tax=Gammaproteobacteria TaxID=1236 RepID=UPI000B48B4E4|nr:AraC family transcriptional regulator [Pseudomonas aeruginosa]EKU7417868.1 AraC family transcriptional regulator [Pseudomonas aeruginosa]EKV4051748.1 AraC family transcriptional regulator [Pseudomonas aeruginosa]MBF2891816.1 AraC family transcriptional regulator [Pseudomonas aeruginosa]MBF2923778.1 AraC family transcriptional regulator [Pseudomonas aeruginosa]MBF2938713.1 AraC family transcriptional regulator [Pseudomonas aeruginosa]